MKKKIIPAIYSEELRRFLEDNAELTFVDQGERFCIICNQPVSVETIQAIVPKNGKIGGYICSNTTCMIEYTNKHEI